MRLDWPTLMRFRMRKDWLIRLRKDFQTQKPTPKPKGYQTRWRPDCQIPMRWAMPKDCRIPTRSGKPKDWLIHWHLAMPTRLRIHWQTDYQTRWRLGSLTR